MNPSILRRGIAVGVAVAAIVLVPSQPADVLAAAERPNIVFILADDLGYGDVGCFGQTRIKTPSIDRMAREGVRFTQFYAGSTVCAPSRCVLMTGLNTGRCFIRGNGRDNLRPDDLTVAKVLKRAGYRTGLFGKWGLGHEGSTGVPTRQGFDEFFGYLDQVHAHNYYPTFLVRNEERVPLENIVPNEGALGQGVASQRVEYSHDRIAEEALSFVDRNREGPFFLYLAFTLPHANNEAGRKGMEVPDLGPYAESPWPEAQKAHAAMITRLDGDVGRMLDRLRGHGIAERTVVFFSSDNGPHKEGGADPSFFDSNGPLRGMKRDLYEGGIRVPTVVWWPGRAPAGRVSDFIGSFADFLPTAAEIAGVESPDRLDGISFLPAILGRSAEQREHESLYWEFYEGGSARAIRMGRWKGVSRPFHGEMELYDLAEDVGETRDVAGQHPDVVARLEAAMDRAHEPSERWKLPEKRPERSGR